MKLGFMGVEPARATTKTLVEDRPSRADVSGTIAPDAGDLLTSASDIAARVTRDLSELRSTLDRVGSEEEADFVGEIAGEFEDFTQHLAALNEKRAELQSRALKCLTAAPQTPGFSE